MIFLFFGSSLAHLEPKLQLFEVWKIMVRQIIITSIAMAINFVEKVEPFGHSEAAKIFFLDKV